MKRAFFLIFLLNVISSMTFANHSENMAEKIFNKISQLDFEDKSYLSEINDSITEKLDDFEESIDLTDEPNLEFHANKTRALYFSMTVFASSIYEIADAILKKIGLRYGFHKSDFRSSWESSQLALRESYFDRNDLLQAKDAVRKINYCGISVVEKALEKTLEDGNTCEYLELKLEIAAIFFLLDNFQEHTTASYNVTLTKDYISALPEDIISFAFTHKDSIPNKTRKLLLFAAPLRFNNFRVRNFNNLEGIGRSVFTPWLQTIAVRSEEMESIFEKNYQKKRVRCIIM